MPYTPMPHKPRIATNCFFIDSGGGGGGGVREVSLKKVLRS